MKTLHALLLSSLLFCLATFTATAAQLPATQGASPKTDVPTGITDAQNSQIGQRHTGGARNCHPMFPSDSTELSGHRSPNDLRKPWPTTTPIPTRGQKWRKQSAPNSRRKNTTALLHPPNLHMRWKPMLAPSSMTATCVSPSA